MTRTTIVFPRGRNLGPDLIARGGEADPGDTSVPGATPDVDVGGTPRSGPPGIGGTSGGPAVDGRRAARPVDLHHPGARIRITP